MLPPPIVSLHIKEKKKKKSQSFFFLSGLKWNIPWLPLQICSLSLTSFLDPQQAKLALPSILLSLDFTLPALSTLTCFFLNRCMLLHSYSFQLSSHFRPPKYLKAKWQLFSSTEGNSLILFYHFFFPPELFRSKFLKDLYVMPTISKYMKNKTVVSKIFVLLEMQWIEICMSEIGL